METEDMVERVTAVLCCHKGECQMRSRVDTCCKSEQYALARDVIEAMREPTREMCHAACDSAQVKEYVTLVEAEGARQLGEDVSVSAPAHGSMMAYVCWRRMLDAALSTTGRGGGEC